MAHSVREGLIVLRNSLWCHTVWVQAQPQPLWQRLQTIHQKYLFFFPSELMSQHFLLLGLLYICILDNKMK